jgi:nitroreductase
MSLPLSPDELLSTTRAVRRHLIYDRPLDLSLVFECLELAVQAPNGGNGQPWHFIIVTDPQKKKQLAAIYRKGWDMYLASSGFCLPPEGKPRSEQSYEERMGASGETLARNMHRAPVLLIPCVPYRIDRDAESTVFSQASTYGSILPAVWSFMLAARARGLGTCWTTLHLIHEEEAAAVLGIPYEQVTQVALIPVAYARDGAFHPGPRKPLDGAVHLNGWESQTVEVQT